jgi:uncharacterized membrane protein
VANGGGLVGSYQVAAGNEWNEPYPQPVLSDVFGIRVLSDTRQFTDTYFRVAEGNHPVAEGLYRERPITCMQRQLLVEATDGAETLGYVVYPYTEWTPNRYVSIHNNPPGVETDRPAIVAHTFGKGRAVYFSAQVGAMYAMSSYWETKQLLANAVRWAANAAAPVELEAPLCVELTAWDQTADGPSGKNRRVIHLVNVQSDISRTVSIKGGWEGGARENLHVIQEILPVYDLKMRFSVPVGKQVKHVSLQPAGITLDAVPEDGALTVQVPKVWIHEAVVVDRAN